MSNVRRGLVTRRRRAPRLHGWSSRQSSSPDGIFQSVQSVHVARPAVDLSAAGARMLGTQYWRETVRASRGVVRFRQQHDGVELRLLGRGPVLLGFDPAETSVEDDRVSCTYRIRGGLLTRRGGGMLVLSQIGLQEIELRTAVTEFYPRLGFVLGYLQQRLHTAISRRYFVRLIAETDQ